MSVVKERKERPLSLLEAESDPSFGVGSLGDHRDIKHAIQIIKGGGIVAGQMRGVFGMWMRGDDLNAVRTSLVIKGDKLDKTLSSMMSSRELVPLIDHDLIPKSLRALVQDADRFQERVGAMCHIRAPIRRSVIDKIPPSILSKGNGRYYMHNLDPYGHRPMSYMVKLLNESGVKFIAVTSMNDHARGEKEISELDRAEEFSRSRDEISLLLKDPTPRREDIKGSYAVIDIEKLEALRDGHIPVDLIERMLEVELDKTNMESSNYPQVDYSPIVGLDIGPEGLRASVLVFLKNDLVFTNQ